LQQLSSLPHASSRFHPHPHLLEPSACSPSLTGLLSSIHFCRFPESSPTLLRDP
jgi:hypothetical protein